MALIRTERVRKLVLGTAHIKVPAEFFVRKR